MMNWAKIYNAEACLERLTGRKSLFELDLFDVQISMKLIGLSPKKKSMKLIRNEWIRMILFPSKYSGTNENEENRIMFFGLYTSYEKQGVYA